MHLDNFGRVSLLAALALVFMSSIILAGEPTAGWNQAAAAGYLDERAKTWFDFDGAGRGQGETKSACVSCHTLVPFAVARPALRKAMGVKRPTEFEAKVIEQTKRRVEHWAELDSPKFRLLYDHGEQKKKEAWGTEAVLNALILALDDRYQGRKPPSDVTRQAFANLWKVQISKGDKAGSWDWLNFGLEPWESNNGRYFGATLAALAVGSAPDYYTSEADAETKKGVELLRTYLTAHLAEQNLYNRTILLWAQNGTGRPLTGDQCKAIVDELFQVQQADGGWRLASLGKFVRGDDTAQDSGSDGYATGLVLHVLQTAGGMSKADPRIAKGLDWLRANQKPTGEWRTSSLNKKRDPTTHVGRFMSDAATAYAVLALSD
jgi:squalene-hopene/tetraprenyl-beta-curcumene cyclase